MPAGRPRLWPDPDEMAGAIDAYFAEAEERGIRPTVAGICYYLGFADRDALSDYGRREGFAEIVKRARLRIEQHLEEHLYTGQVAGVIFNLKNNFGWKDRQITELDVPEETKKALWGK